ncbi:MAG: hypothetical protein QG622_3426 [Actinomycetota bacterium]|nr:hypothetical protein [Actinomycetota bacterium]
MVKQLRAGHDLEKALAADRLGVASVVFTVMAAAAPLTVVAGTVPMAYAVTGNLGLPVAFVALGLLLGVFAVGYVAMSRHLPHTGAFYAYVTHGLGRVPGVAAAWVSLAAYNLLQVSLYGGIGAAVSPLVEQTAGIQLPWWVFALGAWALVGTLGRARVEVSSHVLAVLLVAEVVLVIVVDAAALAHPAAGLAGSAWSPAELFRPEAGAILALAVLGFTGFESAVVFAEECRHPRRTIPAATYLALAVIAVLYGVSSWAITVGIGPADVVATAREQGPDLVFTLAATHLGPAAATAGHALFATSILAAMISFHATTARYVFALGREGVLPGVFGRTCPTGAPRAGSGAQSVIGVAVILTVAVTGADPLVALFYTGAATGALGILILLVLAALAILGFFATDPRGEGSWRTRTAPVLAAVGLLAVLGLVLGNFATLIGVPEASPLRWGLPAAYAAVAAAGAVYALVLRTHRPDVFAVIGQGAKADLHHPVPVPA